jgi:hypothetical protein
VSTETTTYILPAALIGRSDLARLVREVETIDNDLESQKVRNRGTQNGYSMPTMSRSMTDFLQQNSIDVGKDQVRMVVKDQLRKLKDKAPVIHMTFAAEADPEFLQQLTAWIRQNIHPQALLSIGMQPSLVGGVYMRTPNHVHDFSLKSLLHGKRDVIVNELDGALRAAVTPNPISASAGPMEVHREG